MLRDLRYTVRVLRRNRVFSVTVVLTFALAIWLTTSLFTVVYGVLWRPLPYSNPARLVTRPAVSLGAWSAWRHESKAIEDLGLYDFGVEQLLFAGEETARIRQVAVSGNLMSVLGVRPALGRNFQASDSEPGAEPVVMLTDAAWRLYFGTRRDIVGAIAPFDPVSRRVIGVLPPDFVFPMRFNATAGEIRMLTPLANRASQEYTFNVVARLKEGATIAQARAEESAILPRFSSQREAPAQPALMLLSDTMLGGSRQPLLLLLGAVGFLLLLACANVGNLLLAKGTEGRREFAVRFAIGATPRDVLRLLVIQSCVLAVAGGALGGLLAYGSFDVLIAFVPPQLPRGGSIQIDATVIGFAFFVSLVSGAAVGALPAWQLSRGELPCSLQSDDRITLPAGRARLLLLAGEVALAAVLLSGALLFVRSFARLANVNLGFAPRNVLAFHVRTLASRYPTIEHQRAFLDQMLAQLSQVPGVQSVGAVEMLPVARARRGGEPLRIDGRPTLISAEPRVISPRYLEAMSIGVLVGRSFATGDTAAGPQVALVNETLARRAWPGADPIGRQLLYKGDASREVVGVVRDVRIYSVETPPEPQLYIPFSQTWLIPQQFVIKTDGDSPILGAAIRHRIHEIDSRASVEDMEALSAHVAAGISQPRFQAFALGIFAGTGLLLAMVGIAGVVAYAVSRRKRELGIRLALGATPHDLVRTVMAPCLVAAASGACVGVAAALILEQLARAFLFEIRPEDPLTVCSVVVVLAATALAAAWIPARRAAVTDPIAALRAE